MSHHKSWALLSIGLLLVVLGTLSLMFLLSHWEHTIRDKKENVKAKGPLPVDVNDTNRLEPKVTQLNPSLTSGFGVPFQEEQSSKENEEILKSSQASQKIERLQEENLALQAKIEEFGEYKIFAEEQLRQKHIQAMNLQDLLHQQTNEMEKREEQIHHLDTKIHALSGEIKNLLHVHQKDPSIQKSAFFGKILEENEGQTGSPAGETDSAGESHPKETAVQTPLEAAKLLKKCIHKVQKLTGGNYTSQEPSRYRTLSTGNFAIDQRRLFDMLRTETGGLLVVCGQNEEKLLFAGPESKTILGWKPEKFVADFPSIMQGKWQDWQKAIRTLSHNSESQARLLAKTKQGDEVFLDCHFGVVPSGLFRNYVIGVLYPIAKKS